MNLEPGAHLFIITIILLLRTNPQVVPSRFHVKCFSCAVCSTPFEGVYWEHENKALCEQHYLQKAGKKCSKCSQLISGPVVK